MSEERLFEETLREADGFLTNRERNIVMPLAQIAEANDLIYNGIYRGKRVEPHVREFLIREAMTTSDFPYLFGDVLDRQVLANYKAVDPVWKAYTRQSTVKDFKTSRRFAITGGDQYLDKVGEKGEYPASTRTEDYYDISVYKYGRQFDISWEAIINDDLGALRDTPERFARAAIRTEHREALRPWVHDVGATHAANLYATGGADINCVASLLTIANLETAFEFMAGLTDAQGEAIQNRPKYLVVPPALEMTARQILTSATKQWMELGGAGGPLPYPTTNVIAQSGLTLVVDPYIPIMDTVNNAGVARATRNTGWYLFSDPKEIAAVEVAHLKGHERPEICMKASDKVTVGGGAIGPMSGDFATDNIFYRVRIVFGATTLDWRATYMGGHTD